MRTPYYLLFCLLLLSACHKDSISYEQETEISSPEVIEYPVYLGTVLSETGDKQADVKVDVFQNDEIIGTVFTDEEGRYSTHEIAIEAGKKVTIKYEKEAFSSKYRRHSNTEIKKHENELVIGADDLSEGEVTDLVNPSDTNYVQLFGYIKLLDGTPVSGARFSAVLSYYITGSGSLWVKKSIKDYTDSDGYFEVLVPKNKTIHIKARKSRFPQSALSQCIEFFNIESGLLERWNYTELGIIENDTQVFLRDDVEFNTVSSHVRGKALSCDGVPITEGILRVGFMTEWEMLFSGLVKLDAYSFGPNGEFDIELETCPLNGGLELSRIGVSIIDEQNNFSSGLVTIAMEDQVDFGNVLLCQDDNDYPDDFHLELGNESIDFETGGDSGTSDPSNLITGFNHADGQNRISIYFQVDSLQIGFRPIKKLWMYRATKKPDENIAEIYETTFDLEFPDDIICTISSIEGNYVDGTLAGEVITPQGLKSLNASFHIYNK